MPEAASAGGLSLPDDFPSASYASLRDRVLAGSGGRARAEFLGAWDGLALRYLDLADHEAGFTRALREGGPAAPEPALRYAQERELAGFLVAGLMTIESLAYGLFAIGVALRPDVFALETPTDRRNATIGATMRWYGEAFHDEELTRLLFWWLNSREFGWWKEAAGVVSQRASPGRPEPRSAAGGADDEAAAGVWRLRGVEIAPAGLGGRRRWMAELLESLLGEADRFAAARLGSAVFPARPILGGYGPER